MEERIHLFKLFIHLFTHPLVYSFNEYLVSFLLCFRQKKTKTNKHIETYILAVSKLLLQILEIKYLKGV